jgi:hypothetical protein
MLIVARAKALAKCDPTCLVCGNFCLIFAKESSQLHSKWSVNGFSSVFIVSLCFNQTSSAIVCAGGDHQGTLHNYYWLKTCLKFARLRERQLIGACSNISPLSQQTYRIIPLYFMVVLTINELGDSPSLLLVANLAVFDLVSKLHSRERHFFLCQVLWRNVCSPGSINIYMWLTVIQSRSSKLQVLKS